MPKLVHAIWGLCLNNSFSRETIKLSISFPYAAANPNWPTVSTVSARGFSCLTTAMTIPSVKGVFNAQHHDRTQDLVEAGRTF